MLCAMSYKGVPFIMSAIKKSVARSAVPGLLHPRRYTGKN